MKMALLETNETIAYRTFKTFKSLVNSHLFACFSEKMPTFRKSKNLENDLNSIATSNVVRKKASGNATLRKGASNL